MSFQTPTLFLSVQPGKLDQELIGLAVGPDGPRLVLEGLGCFLDEREPPTDGRLGGGTLNRIECALNLTRGMTVAAPVVLGWRPAVIVGLELGYLLGGTVIIEEMFFMPGIGQLTVSALLKRDLPILQGVLLFYSAVFVLVNLAVDVLYGRIDPRIRYE